MEERDKKTELLVGLFLLIGLLLISGLILEFSNVREVFKSTYSITATFPDGSGIGDNTPVVLGGSRVGKVNARPKLNATFDGVIIPLEIYNTVHIPSDAKFTIGTAGLLGDSFIQIKPSGKETTDYVKPGAIIAGESNKLASLQNTAEDVAKKLQSALDDISATVKDVRGTLKRINDGALSDDAMKDLRETFKHINNVVTRLDEKTLGEDTSKNLKDAIASFKNAASTLETTMKKFDPTVDKVNGVVDKADKAMVSADSALKTLDKTAASLGDAVKDLRSGNGLFAALLNDRRLRDNFQQLISNLKDHGVLFYRNSSDKDDADQRPRPVSPRR